MNNLNRANPTGFIPFLQEIYPVSDIPLYLKDGLNNIPFIEMFGSEFSAHCQTYAHLLSLSTYLKNRYTKAGKRHTVRFISKIEEHFTEQQEVGFYARSLFIADDYLREVCRNTTQQRPLYWINLRKVIEALFLLQGTNKQVQEIALDCGVDNRSYFCTLFKKVTGMTPNGFREGLG